MSDETYTEIKLTSTDENQVGDDRADLDYTDDDHAELGNPDYDRDDDQNNDQNNGQGDDVGDDPRDEAGDEIVSGKRVSLVGRFGGMNQREVSKVLRSFDAVVVDLDAKAIDWIVVGAEESPLADAELIGKRLLDASAAGEVEILHETELWQRLGLVDIEQTIRRYYTPVMLAHLLGVSVRVIRRWHRRGLITPVRTLHRLPYFDFQEVTTARRLASWIASGASPKAIEQRLVELVEILPDMQRPLDQLSILVEGKHVLLRSGEGLIETGGQLRFDFDSFDAEPDVSFSVYNGEYPSEEHPAVLSIYDHQPEPDPIDPLLQQAYEAEDEGDLETAIDMLHILLGRDGPRPELHFQLGELLYRKNEVQAARERFFAAIELDPDFVEARCSLGIVLNEERRYELAIAAFRGALALHDDYPDVHYHLAKVLDKIGRDIEAQHHWQRFLTLAPDSPWANEDL
ncbi:tetratricopeptide repeat protein [Rubripirellula amarantea]|nr:tetratricopeptide repeat protein [Rubripirellula amarantea]